MFKTNSQSFVSEFTKQVRTNILTESKRAIPLSVYEKYLDMWTEVSQFKDDYKTYFGMLGEKLEGAVVSDDNTVLTVPLNHDYVVTEVPTKLLQFNYNNIKPIIGEEAIVKNEFLGVDTSRVNGTIGFDSDKYMMFDVFQKGLFVTVNGREQSFTKVVARMLKGILQQLKKTKMVDDETLKGMLDNSLLYDRKFYLPAIPKLATDEVKAALQVRIDKIKQQEAKAGEAKQFWQSLSKEPYGLGLDSWVSSTSGRNNTQAFGTVQTLPQFSPNTQTLSEMSDKVLELFGNHPKLQEKLKQIEVESEDLVKKQMVKSGTEYSEQEFEIAVGEKMTNFQTMFTVSVANDIYNTVRKLVYMFVVLKTAMQCFETESIRANTKDGKMQYNMVFSHNPREVATISTNRDWSSCQLIGNYGYSKVWWDVKFGSIAVYITNTGDTKVEEAIARLSIKQFATLGGTEQEAHDNPKNVIGYRGSELGASAEDGLETDSSNSEFHEYIIHPEPTVYNVISGGIGTWSDISSIVDTNAGKKLISNFVVEFNKLHWGGEGGLTDFHDDYTTFRKRVSLYDDDNNIEDGTSIETHKGDVLDGDELYTQTSDEEHQPVEREEMRTFDDMFQQYEQIYIEERNDMLSHINNNDIGHFVTLYKNGFIVDVGDFAEDYSKMMAYEDDYDEISLEQYEDYSYTNLAIDKLKVDLFDTVVGEFGNNISKHMSIFINECSTQLDGYHGEYFYEVNDSEYIAPLQVQNIISLMDGAGTLIYQCDEDDYLKLYMSDNQSATYSNVLEEKGAEWVEQAFEKMLDVATTKAWSTASEESEYNAPTDLTIAHINLNTDKSDESVWEIVEQLVTAYVTYALSLNNLSEKLSDIFDEAFAIENDADVAHTIHLRRILNEFDVEIDGNKIVNIVCSSISDAALITQTDVTKLKEVLPKAIYGLTGAMDEIDDIFDELEDFTTEVGDDVEEYADDIMNNELIGKIIGKQDLSVPKYIGLGKELYRDGKAYNGEQLTWGTISESINEVVTNIFGDRVVQNIPFEAKQYSTEFQLVPQLATAIATSLVAATQSSKIYEILSEINSKAPNDVITGFDVEETRLVLEKFKNSVDIGRMNQTKPNYDDLFIDIEKFHGAVAIAVDGTGLKNVDEIQIKLSFKVVINALYKIVSQNEDKFVKRLARVLVKMIESVIVADKVVDTSKFGGMNIMDMYTTRTSPLDMRYSKPHRTAFNGVVVGRTTWVDEIKNMFTQFDNTTTEFADYLPIIALLRYIEPLVYHGDMVGSTDVEGIAKWSESMVWLGLMCYYEPILNILLKSSQHVDKENAQVAALLSVTDIKKFAGKVYNFIQKKYFTHSESRNFNETIKNLAIDMQISNPAQIGSDKVIKYPWIFGIGETPVVDGALKIPELIWEHDKNSVEDLFKLGVDLNEIVIRDEQDANYSIDQIGYDDYEHKVGKQKYHVHTKMYASCNNWVGSTHAYKNAKFDLNGTALNASMFHYFFKILTTANRK